MQETQPGYFASLNRYGGGDYKTEPFVDYVEQKFLMVQNCSYSLTDKHFCLWKFSPFIFSTKVGKYFNTLLASWKYAPQLSFHMHIRGLTMALNFCCGNLLPFSVTSRILSWGWPAAYNKEASHKIEDKDLEAMLLAQKVTICKLWHQSCSFYLFYSFVNNHHCWLTGTVDKSLIFFFVAWIHFMANIS